MHNVFFQATGSSGTAELSGSNNFTVNYVKHVRAIYSSETPNTDSVQPLKNGKRKEYC